MSLTIILFCLVAERFLLKHQHIRQAGWFRWYRDWFERFEPPTALRQGFGGVISLLLPPLLIVALLQQLVDSHLFGIPETIFACLVLLYCFGPEDLDSQVTLFTESRDKGNDDYARTIARELLLDEPPANAPSLSQAVTESILDQANERIYAVIFWFLILGPVGAALYRLSSLLRSQQNSKATIDFLQRDKQLMAILNWAPARITAVLYALVGSFEDALVGWRSYSSNHSEEFRASASGILINTGLGALKFDGPRNPTNHAEYLYLPDAAMGLVWRTLIVWLALLSIFTFAGWI